MIIELWFNIPTSSSNRRLKSMATAKKAASKAAPTPATVAIPARAAQPAAKAPAKKAPVSKSAKEIAKLSASIAKLTERKDKIAEEIKVFRDQRTALKAAAAIAPAPVVPVAKSVKKVVPNAVAKPEAPNVEAPKAAATKRAGKPAKK